jgi:hypothetical protein
LDLDPDGYRLEADGTDRGGIHRNGILRIRLEPGRRTITLTGLGSNCTVEGTRSREMTIVTTEVVPVEFVVVCTATTGVIGVRVDATGTDVDGSYTATVDGPRDFSVRPTGLPYWTDVIAGDHAVSLGAPVNCSIDANPQIVAVAGGGLIRDTVEVSFSVRCRRGVATFRITAITSGLVPSRDYSVWMCDFADSYYCRYSRHTRLGVVPPNGTRTLPGALGTHRLWLQDLPSNCSGSSSFDPTRAFTVAAGDTLDFTFHISCAG